MVAEIEGSTNENTLKNTEDIKERVKEIKGY